MMFSFRDYLGLSDACSYDVDDVIGRADRFGFQNFCSPVPSLLFNTSRYLEILTETLNFIFGLRQFDCTTA